jgi:pimeloyl-ACP methyl ester carboxylesterase
MKLHALSLAISLGAAVIPSPGVAQTPTVAADTVHYRTVTVDGVNIFYREAGRPDAPTIVLLHGFPTSSAMYRGLILLLASHFHVLAPDYPGYGHSDAPPPQRYAYTFDHLAQTMRGFLDQLGVHETILYLQDFGGPVGFRLALAQPERVRGLVVQNANAYLEGFSPELLAGVRKYWASRTPETEQAQRFAFSPDGIRWQYVTGAHDPAALDPDTWTLDIAQMARPGEDAIQLDMLYDYRTNVASYPAWQAWLKQHQPRTLIVWGKGDPLFRVDAAHALKRDLPAAKLVVYDGGHFMLQEHAAAVAGEIVAMFGTTGSDASVRGH